MVEDCTAHFAAAVQPFQHQDVLVWQGHVSGTSGNHVRNIHWCCSRSIQVQLDMTRTTGKIMSRLLGHNAVALGFIY